MKKPRVAITGIGGTLGRALGDLYQRKGWEVTGVSTRKNPGNLPCHRHVNLAQDRGTHAGKILDLEPDLIILNAGAIETELGPMGMPLMKSVNTLAMVHFQFPAEVITQAVARRLTRPLTILCIGTIADGSPSVFGPVYHATKSALHQFISGTAPIAHKANPHLTVRLYRPGVILGDFSWAPMLRLGPKAMAIREKRCASAPGAEVIASQILRFLEGKATVGGDVPPLSFRLLAAWYALFPGSYANLQQWAWKRHSKWAEEEPALRMDHLPTEL